MPRYRHVGETELVYTGLQRKDGSTVKAAPGEVVAFAKDFEHYAWVKVGRSESPPAEVPSADEGDGGEGESDPNPEPPVDVPVADVIVV